jgi:hypothetical protein
LESLRARFALAAIATLAGCSSSAHVSPSASQTFADHARLSAVAEQGLSVNGVPFVGSRQAWINLFNAAPAAHRSVPPNLDVAPEKATPWGASVFVSDFGTQTSPGAVYQFASKKNGKLLGTISDVVNPQGMDTDSNGNLWVASTGNSTIREYPKGKFVATTVLSDNDEFPVSVAVCPNGTIYGSNADDYSQLPGNIVIYASGSTSPTGTVPETNIFRSYFVACDQSNTLWFDYINLSNQPAVASYNGTTVTEYGSLGLTPYEAPGGIRASNDGKTLAIVDQSAAQIDFFTKSNLSQGPYLKLGNVFTLPVSFSFIKSQKNVWVADDTKLEALEVTLKGKVPATVGTGTLVTPIDAFVFPAGNT